jgi:Beta-galactosidase/beta-glucuronidase
MRLDLNGDWYIRYTELECNHEGFKKILEEAGGWMKSDVPCDIHELLVREGIIKEPLVGLNCFECEWVGEKAWWFRKFFRVDNEQMQGDVVELVLESLDIGADIILNGQHIGTHMSAFYPYRKDVKGILHEGENQLLIRLTTGLDRVINEDLKGYVISTEDERRAGRGEAKRAFLRKPQYSFGWDWGPKLFTCGIAKDVWLESHKKAAIRWVHTYVKSLQPKVMIGFSLEVENFHHFSTLDGCARIGMAIAGEKAACIELDVMLKSGLNYIDAELEIENAKLWWPNGMGEQHLYTVNVEISLDGDIIHYPDFKYGIRTIALDTSRIRDGERLFAVMVNGVKTFCKGANWIPADSIYARVTGEKYEKLIMEAKEANFNMLRIWGGGLYERDIFYKMCDHLGIMLWHDFMFACSEYPENREAFLKIVEQEIDYQTKKLRNHPSIVLWCGNNENHWGFDEWWEGAGCFGSKIYNYVAPEAVRRNCSGIPYWNSSPYGGFHPNGSQSGDRHHWHDCMMNSEMEKRITPEEYDKVTAKFVSEYGYIGPMKRSSIGKYLDGAPFDINGEVWQHHNNTFEKDTVLAGIKYHYCDTENLDVDSYMLFAGLCQGLMYGYSLEAFRFNLECSGGLFWMYNDCWGETGWTIIDYYTVRKISYYFVKRALAPVKFIIREDNGLISVVGINDGQLSKELDVEYGYVSFDGVVKEVKRTVLPLAPHNRGLVLKFEKGDYEKNKGVYYVRVVNGEDIPLSLLRTATYREMAVPPAELAVEALERRDAKVFLTVRSSGFAHAVHFKLPDEINLSDEYFDMLPGESRRVIIYKIPDDMDIKAIKAYAV